MTRFTVNGNPIEYLLEADTPLLWAIRDASNLTGTKYGCDDGSCGACTVLVDDEPTLACSVSIGAMEGHFITTIEGLSGTRDHPLQSAFLKENAAQCGFCTSGMLLKAAALLKTNRHPNDEHINQTITNICRCGAYPAIRRAIKEAARSIRQGNTSAATSKPPASPNSQKTE